MLFETCVDLPTFATGWAMQTRGASTMSDSNFDPRSIATAPIVGLNAATSLLEYQASLLKLWAENCELMARNYEKGLEAFSLATGQRRDAA